MNIHQIKKNSSVVGFDWLQIKGLVANENIYNLQTSLELVHKAVEENDFVIFPIETENKFFNKVYQICLWKVNKVFAEIRFNPKSSILHENTFNLQVQNEFLYKKNLANSIQYIVQKLDLQVSGFTRVDLFFDKEEKKEGYSSRKFFKDVTSDIITKKKNVKDTIFRQYPKSNEINAMYFGSRKSEVFIRIYDKTFEFESKRDKKHIRDFWKINGFDEKNDVFRYEFECRNFDKTLRNKETGEILYDKDNYMDLFLNFEKIFEYLIDTRFLFEYKEPTSKKKSTFKPICFQLQITKYIRYYKRYATTGQKAVKQYLKQFYIRHFKLFRKNSHVFNKIMRFFDMELKRLKLEEWFDNREFQFQLIALQQ